jgi:hypothetical protein
MDGLRSSVLALAVSGFLAGAAPAVTIDDFLTGPITMTGPSGPTDQSGLSATSIIGGGRQVSIDSSSGPTTTLEIGGGVLEFASGAGPQRGYMHITYGATTPLAANLTAGGYDRIRVTVHGVELSGAYIALLTMRDASGGVKSFPLDVGLNALNGDSGFLEFPLTGLTIDMSNISRIDLALTRFPVNATLRLGPIRTAGAPLPGDYNRNGTVDVKDYLEWKRLYGRSVTGTGVLLAADGNGDGRIDAVDYTVWRNAMTDPGTGGLAAVPEPSIAALAVAGAVGLAIARRRRVA